SGSYSVTGNSGAKTGSFQCRFPDGPATTHVTLSFTDSDGDTGNTADQQVDVANVAPTAHLNGPANVAEGSTHPYSFTVTDPGQDTFSVNEPTYPACGSAGTYVS